jgi:hypothetical protein
MQLLHTVWLTALLAVIVNLPFGYWREGCRKFSRSWFVAVHVPIMLTIGLRFGLGIPFRLVTLPLYVLAFVGGQFLGALIRRQRKGKP